MAQLVKLQDYISRYQIDLARYPTQFIRLKKGQWERVKYQWQTGGDIGQWEHIEVEAEEVPIEKSRFSFLKKLLPNRAKEDEKNEDVESVDVSTELDEDYIPEEETTLHFEPNIVYNPQTVAELKHMFMDQFFHFQMKWASSTLREKSYVDPKFMRDTLLRSLLQTLPDSYLIFYRPILRLKKAPIELEIIILTPTECYIVKVLEEENQAVYIGGGERFWTKKVGKLDKKTLSPIIDLNRTETIVTRLFQEEGIEIPIRKVILSRNGYIDYPSTVYGLQFIDKRKFPQWMEQLKRSVSPMKHMQIRAAQAILKSAETTSFHRDIWHVEASKEQ
ncbi:nuclease-related domain-containing protein [Lysinibacillus sp. LZ02]|uniref:nuclease-related domain-containing protein n=1 Tax=Lysinibacillus sp. LZ02 TaxID=3420668 RepID=UPI003D365959